MTYTEQEIEQIIDQLRQIKINDVPVFFAFIDDVSDFYHHVYIDAGLSIARFDFKKAPETTSESEATA